MEKIKKRRVAVAIFYDFSKNIFVQERGTHSKNGEKYGFWGGRIEEGETSEEALRRELKEELSYSPDKLEFWETSEHLIKDGGKWDGWTIELNIFLSEINNSLLKSKVMEGVGGKKMKIENAIKDDGFSMFDRNVLKKFLESNLNS